MKEFLMKFFGDGDGTTTIELYDIWHFVYIALIIATVVLVPLILRKKKEGTTDNVQRILATAIISLYVLDFFIMPFSLGYINIDKLPFHICTAMGVLIPFVQFNEKFRKSWVIEVLSCIGVVSSLVYIVYPGSALGEAPWAYTVTQTMLFHSMILLWSINNIVSGTAVLEFKNIWKTFCGVVAFILWAGFGILCYNDYNWCFIKDQFVSFIPKEAMPFVVTGGLCLLCTLVYLTIFVVKKISQRKTSKEEKAE